MSQQSQIPGFLARLCECGVIVHIPALTPINDPARCKCERAYFADAGTVVEVVVSVAMIKIGRSTTAPEAE